MLSGRTSPLINYPGLLFPAFIAGLPLVFFWKLVFLGQVVFWGTPLLQFYPWRKLAVELYKSGHLPLWDPYVGFGAPLAANLQSAVFYPLNFFYLFVPIEKAMGYTIVLHVALAGIFMYALARVLGISTLGSFMAALAYMFSGYIISRAHFLSMVVTLPWLPLLIAAAEGVLVSVRGPRMSIKNMPWGWMFLLTLGTGLLLLAGHIQLAFYTLLALSGYAVFRAIAIVRAQSSWSRAAVPLGVFGVCLVLGVALAGVQLVPTAELAMHSVRSSGAGYDFALTYSLWPWQLLGAVFPTILGTPAGEGYWGPGNFWESAMYIGGFPLFLAAIGALGKLGRARFFFIALGLVAVVLSLGYNTPLYPWLFSHVPGFGLFQAPSRFLFLYTFAAAVLCGFGLDTAMAQALSARTLSRLKYVLRLAAAGGGAVALFAGAIVLIGKGAGLMSLESALHITVTGLLFSLACLVLLRYHRGWNRTSLYALPFLVFAELFLYGSGLNPSASSELYNAPSLDPARYLEKQEGMERVYTSEEVNLSKFSSAFNFKSWGTTDWTELLKVRSDLPPNLSASHHIFEAHNYDPIRLARPSELTRRAEEKGLPPNVLTLMNVKYVITGKKAQLGSASVSPPPATSAVPAGLEVRADPLPRAFVASRVLYAESDERAIEILFSPGFDPRNEAVVEGRLEEIPTRATSTDRAQVNITKYAANQVVMDVDASGGVLVLSDAYYPGWRAFVDGVEREVLIANHSFRAVAITPGRHEVVFRYEPDSFKLGVSLSGLAALCLVASGLMWVRGRSRSI